MESVGSNFEKESIGSNFDKESVGSNFEMEYYDLGLWKKTKIAEEDYDVLLILTIHHAEGIDNPSTNPSIANRIYKVVSWVEVGNMRTTPEVYGLPNPEWHWTFFIRLKNPIDCRYLSLEVIRTHSWSDPGTSSGEVLVGRARIPLPKLSTKTAGRFGLVRLEGPRYKAEGHIILAMELIKIEKAT